MKPLSSSWTAIVLLFWESKCPKLRCCYLTRAIYNPCWCFIIDSLSALNDFNHIYKSPWCIQNNLAFGFALCRFVNTLAKSSQIASLTNASASTGLAALPTTCSVSTTMWSLMRLGRETLRGSSITRVRYVRGVHASGNFLDEFEKEYKFEPIFRAVVYWQSYVQQPVSHACSWKRKYCVVHHHSCAVRHFHFLRTLMFKNVNPGTENKSSGSWMHARAIGFLRQQNGLLLMNHSVNVEPMEVFFFIVYARHARIWQSVVLSVSWVGRIVLVAKNRRL